MEPWYVPFAWTGGIALVGFITGDALARSGFSAWDTFMFGLIYALACAAARLLLYGLATMP